MGTTTAKPNYNNYPGVSDTRRLGVMLSLLVPLQGHAFKEAWAPVAGPSAVPGEQLLYACTVSGTAYADRRSLFKHLSKKHEVLHPQRQSTRTTTRFLFRHQCHQIRHCRRCLCHQRCRDRHCHHHCYFHRHCCRTYSIQRHDEGSL